METEAGLPEWQRDEEGFEEHFGVDYKSFCAVLNELPSSKIARYEDLRERDPEAAICWAIVQGRKLGLFRV